LILLHANEGHQLGGATWPIAVLTSAFCPEWIVTAGANARRTRRAAVLMPDKAAMTEIIPTPMLEITSHASVERKCRDTVGFVRIPTRS
jgi:hypothetical protein